MPFGAGLTAITLDHGGFPNAFPSLRVGVRTNDDDDGWLFLNVRFGPELLDDPEFQKSALAFVRSFADDWNLAYGEISYDRGSGHTAWETVFRGQPEQTSRTSREVLRGYAWLRPALTPWSPSGWRTRESCATSAARPPA